ncbi:MAG: hypothetical protein IJU93_05130 [Lachnospiraceae bacterium]|nr:hypothetical protein [Lachnospiraceae bacterium]
MKKRLLITLALIFAIFVIAFLDSRVDDELYLDCWQFRNYGQSPSYDLGTLYLNAGSITKEDGLYAELKSIELPKGDYLFEIDHECKDDTIVRFMDDEILLAEYTLPKEEIRTNIPYRLDHEVNNFTMRFFYQGGKDVELKHLFIRTSDGHNLFNDTFYIAFLISLFLLAICLFEKKICTPVIIIGAVTALFTILPFLSPKMNQGTDLLYHMMRIQGTFDAIKDGQFPAVIYPRTLHGHGYLGSLYPNLFLYILMIPRIFDVSMPAIWKTAIFASSACTFASAFYSAKLLFEKAFDRDKVEKMAIASAVLYTLAPFRMIRIYYTMTLGETMAVIFFPLVIAGLYSILAGNSSKWYILTFGISGILESHILSFMFACIMCFLFILLLIKELFSEKRYIELIKAAVFTVFLNAGFLVPFFYYRSQALQLTQIEKTNPAKNEMILADLFSTYTKSPADPEAAFLSMKLRGNLTVVGLILLLLTAVYFIRIKETDRRTKFMKTAFLVELIFFFVSTDLFPWKTLEKFERIFAILQPLQHPLRLLVVTVGCACFTAVYAIYTLKIKYTSETAVTVAILVINIMTIVSIFDIYIVKLTTDPVVTANTGNYTNSYILDYVPENTTNAEDIKADQVPVASEGVEVGSYSKKGTHIELTYSNSSNEPGTIRLPLMSYLGYKAYDGSGNRLNISQSEIGTITVTVAGGKENDRLVVNFTQPWFNYLGLLISAAAILWFCFRKNIKVL